VRLLPSLLVGAAALALLGTLAVRAWRFWPYPNDDAFITFRFSRALAEGRGPWFNAGEHVEGYSNPLLMLLVAAWIFLRDASSAALFARLVGVVAGVGAGWFAARLGSAAFEGRGPSGDAASGRLAACAAAGLVAASPAFLVNTLSGLETTLYAALLVAGACWSARGRERRSGAAFALAALTRPEGAAVFAVHWLARLAAESGAEQRRPRLRGLLESGFMVAGVVALQVVLRQVLYDGEWLPNTYYAKAGGFGRTDYWLDIYDGALAPVLGVVGLLAATAGLALDRALARRLLPAFAAGLFAAHLPLLVGPDWMIGARFVVPSLPLLAAACAGAWVALLGRLPLPARAAVAVALPLYSLLSQGAAAGNLRLRLEETRADVAGSHVPLSHFLRARAFKGDALAITDVGLVGFENPDLTVIDISGLTDRAIGKSPGRNLEKRYDPALVLGRRPRWIVFSQECNREAAPPAGLDTEGRIAASPDFAAHYRFSRAFGPPGPGCRRHLYLYERSGG
jgi:hypothetical protein